MDQAQALKIQPEHLPRGTIVTVDPYIVREGESDHRTVDYIMRDGVRHFLIKSTGQRIMFDGSITEDCFSVDWIRSIVKRGDGPVDVRHYTVPRTEIRSRFLRDIWMMELRRDGRPGPGFYQTASLRTVVGFHLFEMGHAMYDSNLEAAVNAVCAQSWCKKVFLSKWGRDGMFYFRVSKKRLVAFLRANQNRFLTPVKVLLRAEKAMMKESDAQYMRDLEEDFDRDRCGGLPDPETDTDQNTVAEESCYMPDDYDRLPPTCWREDAEREYGQDAVTRDLESGAPDSANNERFTLSP